jgi:hypothetical protein
MQRKAKSKLAGLQFTLQYKKGHENMWLMHRTFFYSKFGGTKISLGTTLKTVEMYHQKLLILKFRREAVVTSNHFSSPS